MRTLATVREDLNLKQALKSFRDQHKGVWINESSHLAHLAYFAAVAVEGHGVYAIMGAVLFVLGLLAALYGDGGAE